MTTKLDKIVKSLPGDLSESGIKEVHDIINEVVEDRVAEEMKLLESKVSGFLRTKIEQIKEVAREELQSEDDTYRAIRIYEAIKALVAGDITTEDAESITNAYADTIDELEESVKTLNNALEHAAQENHLLENQLDSVQGEHSVLMEDNLNLQSQIDLPFRSSESALVIHNNVDSKDELTGASSENHFLTEDVVRLSRTFTEEK